MTPRPYSAACERNRAPILDRLGDAFEGTRRVVEIGSGTGQHAAWFAPRLPGLTWVATDLGDRLPGIRAWVNGLEASGRVEVLALDVTRSPWPDLGPVDAAFSANTAHILPESAVEAMFAGLGERLPPGAPLCLYGPFAVDGAHTGPGNAAFDASLRSRDPRMGVRDLRWLEGVGERAGFGLERVDPMPADNRLVTWRKN